MNYRERCLEGLKGTRQKVCCYMGSPCDCKYGIRELEDELKAKDLIRGGSEQTGCPELYDAIAIFSVMTDDEYDEFCRRVRDGAIKKLEEAKKND